MSDLAWPVLLSVALIGTDRHPLPPSQEDDAARVLDGAAAWGVVRRAGTRSVAEVPAAQPAPDEDRPVVVPASAGRLALIIGEGGPFDSVTRTALLTEWLELADRHGQLVPPEFLPDLFELARFQAPLRPLVRAAGGARVEWLAKQNPDWARLIGPARQPTVHSDRAWHEGGRRLRRSYLVGLRRSDPAAALALLEDGWATMGPDERLDLLDVLADNLGAGDEPFLDRALDDRRAEVRRRAADLLGDLPDSGLNRRMAARARAYLTVDEAGVTVTPPVARDADMARDGVSDPPAGSPPRAWWLGEVLSRTPLSALTERPPAEFLALPLADEWRPVVLPALARAAARQHSPQWAAALLDAVAGTDLADVAEMLYPVLGPDELPRRALAAVTNRPAIEWVAALQRCPAPWPADLAAAALRAWESAAATDEPTDSGRAAVLEARNLTRALDRLSRPAALAMPSVLAGEAAAAARRVQDAAHPDARVDPLAYLAGVLHFRQQMMQEIA
jgi:hypothetical protein